MKLASTMSDFMFVEQKKVFFKIQKWFLTPLPVKKVHNKVFALSLDIVYQDSVFDCTQQHRTQVNMTSILKSTLSATSNML